MKSTNVYETGAVTALLLLLLSLGPSNSADNPGDSSAGVAAAGPKSRDRRHTPFMPEDHWKGPPEFGETETNLSVMVNGTAELRCPIARVQDSAISFVRQRDFRILSNGHSLFTTDKRFQIIHRAKTIDWILRLKRVQLNDSGKYMCQVAIKAGLFSLPFSLEVFSPRAAIVGGSEFHLDRGSTISLSCLVKQATEQTQFIFWYHDSKMINYEDPNGGGEGGGVGGRSSTGVSVRTRMSGDGMETTSRLILRNAAPGDSGNYTCQPSNAQSASIHVFVSEDRLSEPLLRPEAKDKAGQAILPSSSSSSSSSSSMSAAAASSSSAATSSAVTVATFVIFASASAVAER